jgi:hypothetical protein
MINPKVSLDLEGYSVLFIQEFIMYLHSSYILFSSHTRESERLRLSNSFSTMETEVSYFSEMVPVRCT